VGLESVAAQTLPSKITESGQLRYPKPPLAQGMPLRSNDGSDHRLHTLESACLLFEVFEDASWGMGVLPVCSRARLRHVRGTLIFSHIRGRVCVADAP